MLEPLPVLRKPDRPAPRFERQLPAGAALGWLRAGWRDAAAEPWSSAVYGSVLTLTSYVVLWALHAGGLLYLALLTAFGTDLVARAILSGATT